MANLANEWFPECEFTLFGRKAKESPHITLPSGKRGWAIYKDGKVVEQYAVMR